MEQERLLWELQELVQEAYTLQKKETLKPLVVQLKQLQESIKRGEEKVAGFESEVATLEIEGLNLEKQATQNQEQLKSCKEKLYSAKGGALKELLSLQQHLANIEEEATKNEKLYFETLRKAEELKEALVKDGQVIRGLKKQYNEILKTYRVQQKNLELKLAELELKQEQVKEQMTPEVLKLFVETEKRHPGQPVARLKGEACTGCHIGIASFSLLKIKEGKTIHFCDNCGRILINI